ncbi:MAG: hypothetical protein ACK4GJ_06590 [bacterium]
MSFEYSLELRNRNVWYNYGPSLVNRGFYGYRGVKLQNYLYGAFGGIGGFGGFYGGFGGIYNYGMGFGFNSLTPIYRNVFEQYDINQTGRMWDYKFDSVLGRRDPVIIDVDGDGKPTVTSRRDELGIPSLPSLLKWRKESIQFDINGDGIPDRTQWVRAQGDKTDAFVTYLTPEQQRLLQEGKYDQIKLDGRNLMTETGIDGRQNVYRNGYEKMRALYDKNGDGVISGDELKNVYIWQDKNGDGKVQEGELKTAAEWGIKQFDTNKETYTRKVGEIVNYRQDLAGYRYDSYFGGFGGFGFGGFGFGGFGFGGFGFGGFGFGGFGFGGFGFGGFGFGYPFF